MEVINTLLANNLKAGQWFWPSMILIFKSANKKKKSHLSGDKREFYLAGERIKKVEFE